MQKQNVDSSAINDELLIQKLSLQFGSSPEQNPLEFNPGHLTIFVGPNNSGKSLTLKEINSYGREPNKPRKIISSLGLKELTDPKVLKSYIEKDKLSSQQDSANFIYCIPESHSQWHSISIKEEEIFRLQQNESFLFNWLWTAFCIQLDGKARLSLVEPQPSGNLSEPPRNPLAAMFSDRNRLLKVRKIIKDTFNYHFLVDPTSLTRFEIRMSLREAEDQAEENNIFTDNKRALDFYKSAMPIAEFSDGIKAFMGLLLALIAGRSKIMLIDEPEAFLHPPLARKLGYYISQLSQETSANVFIATHSKDFVMGCIETGIPLNIVRLTHDSKGSTARMISSEQLAEFMLDPLLRSTNFLDALFYERVIVVEADSDRCFYQEINYRLLTHSEGGASNTLFINAHNKQTLQRILKPLRQLGIPSVAIVDIDILKSKESWTDFLISAQIPKITREALSTSRSNLDKVFDEIKASKNKSMAEGGIKLLHGEMYKSCEDLFDQLKKYGICVVPNGALESWLEELKVTSRKGKWLEDIFKRMGSNPTDSEYIFPHDKDVWKFLREITTYLSS